MSDYALSKAIEVVKGRVYYIAVRAHPRPRADCHFFTIDDTLVYWNFFLDFGPLNLGQTYRFCSLLNMLIKSKEHAGKRIYYYSSTHAHKRTNAAWLISAYRMMFMGMSPEDAFSPFSRVQPPFPYFHDASPFVCTYNLSILDCLRGMKKAHECGFFSFDNFDINEYEHFEKVENGDLNWLAYGKFLAFAGPHETRSMTAEGYYTLCPDDYIPYYKKKGVSLVIRLNKKYYNQKRFLNAGIDHVDLYYMDGSNPPKHILEKFIQVCEQAKGAIAVHCKAGLGRTGTCIGAFMMKHYKFTAAEVIGWLRICRPGSIIGPQQHFMKEIERPMWNAGEQFRRRGGQGGHVVPRHIGASASPSSSSAASTPKRMTTRSMTRAGAGAGAGSGSAASSGSSGSRRGASSSRNAGRSSGYGKSDARTARPRVQTRAQGRSHTRSQSGTSRSSTKHKSSLSSAGRLGVSRALGRSGSSRSRTSPIRNGSSGSAAAGFSSPTSVASDASQGDELRAARAKRSPTVSRRSRFGYRSSSYK